MEELLHPLLKVPFEKANKSFRLFHKHVSREVASLQKIVLSLQDEQSAAQHTRVQDTIESLENIAERVRSAQKNTKQFLSEQQKDINSCVLRAQYVKKYQESSDTLAASVSSNARVPAGELGSSSFHLANAFGKSDQQAMENDRMIAEYLLSHGFINSSKIIQESKGVEFVVDHDLHLQCHSIMNDLHAHNVSTAIAWCSENGSRLRRLQSQLEFQLRLQDFIELVRSDKKLDAIHYAQAHLTPASMQQEDETVRQSMMTAIQEAMATLAYKTPEQCGVEAYTRLFSKDRWQQLKEAFRRTFFLVYGIHNPPGLCIALHAGLTSLNTRACRRHRDATAETLKRRRGNDMDENYSVSSDEEDIQPSESESAQQRSKKSKIVPLSNLAHSTSGEIGIDADKSNLFDRLSTPPLCPTCSEVGGKLCGALPFAHHPHSRLVCRVTNSVMDEHNPPVALPNGYVYSRRAIQQLTVEDGTMVTCAVTQDKYSATVLKPVYIL